MQARIPWRPGWSRNQTFSEYSPLHATFRDANRYWVYQQCGHACRASLMLCKTSNIVGIGPLVAEIVVFVVTPHNGKSRNLAARRCSRGDLQLPRSSPICNVEHHIDTVGLLQTTVHADPTHPTLCGNSEALAHSNGVLGCSSDELG